MDTTDPDRFKKLPPPVKLEDTREVHDVEPLRPERSPDEVDREIMLRNAGLPL